MREPKIHSHITDVLPEEHPRAHDKIMCDADGCDEVLHYYWNECMTTWVETGKGNFCLRHFVQLGTYDGTDGFPADAIDEDCGLPEDGDE